jgi:AcrR family transcriptional regulator
LLAGVAVEGFHALTDALAAAAQTDARDPAARLQALGSAYVGFALGHPGRLRLMFGPELAGWLQRDPALRAAAQETSTVLARAVREVIGEGDATIGTLAVWSLMHGLAHLILDVDIAPNRMGGAAMDKLVHQVIGVIARGLELSPAAELSGDAPGPMAAATPEPQRAVGD